MITVILSHPNGNRQEVLLADVPRVGDRIRLADMPVDAPALVVEYVMWVEGGNGTGITPQVIIVVRSGHPEPGV